MQHIRNRHLLLADLLLIPLAVYLSYVLRLEAFEPARQWCLGMALLSGTALLFTLAFFRSLGIYSRYWRFASIYELMLLTGAHTVAAILAGVTAMALSWFLYPQAAIPRSIPFLYLLLGMVATVGTRVLVGAAGRLQYPGRPRPEARPVLIMGAGEAGTLIARELRSNPHLGLRAVGFVDDDLAKQGLLIHGLPVLGGQEDIPRLVREHGIAQVIIAMPTAPGKVIRSVVQRCEAAGVPARTVPGVYELLDGKASVSQVRTVQIEDLLRRAPIQTDLAAVARLLSGRRVLITGGGGSIGSELARQVLQCRPRELILLGHGETSIFHIYHELVDGGGGEAGVTIRPVIADVRNQEYLTALFQQLRPEIVFHAAAHKHVPLMEANPAEAVFNNVLGTRVLVRTAAAVGVERFVMISTDKAVNPTSVMGATKRLAELMVLQVAQATGRPYVAVRFGNVLGSRGSVVQIFRRQIASGGPLTVTHPEVKRYFMTIPEAVQLVLQASVLGQGGEIFTLDMGEPVKIVDLAQDLIRLSGLQLGRDIDIVFTGLRPGEKLFEELFVPGEEYVRTCHEQIFVAANASALLPPELDRVVEQLLAAACRNDGVAVVTLLQALLPEFRPVGTSVVGCGRRQATFVPNLLAGAPTG
ncbi:MAG: polysaccharide biosynthesis protein CapD [Litorilinea sp.]|nr:MAG: polysaccharide biosynthesis protein CapD [Litorilinea sp.]